MDWPRKGDGRRALKKRRPETRQARAPQVRPRPRPGGKPRRLLVLSYVCPALVCEPEIKRRKSKPRATFLIRGDQTFSSEFFARSRERAQTHSRIMAQATKGLMFMFKKQI